MKIFFESDAFYSGLIDAISKAQHEIWMEYYIFDYDAIGSYLMHHLREAASRGVRVHLLVDAIGSSSSLSRIEEECQGTPIEVRAFHRVTGLLGHALFGRLSGLGRRLIGFYINANQRNHRKITLIDGVTLFIGSQNVSIFHSRKWRGMFAWRDTGLQIQKSPAWNEAFSHLRRSMMESWRYCNSYRRPFLSGLRSHRPKSPIRLNSRRHWRKENRRSLLRKFNNAKNRIWITNPYFLPGAQILRALRRARQRGVDVCILLPYKSDVWIVQEASKSLYPGLLRSGVEIYEYEKSVLHAKSILVDDWALVGSHNFNYRSFFHDLEVDVEIEDPQIIRQLAMQWQVDLLDSRPILETPQVGFAQTLLRRLILLLRYWL